MNVLKKILIVYFSILFIMFCMSVRIDSNDEESTGSNDYARITDVDYKAVVIDEPNSGGKVLITERLTYDIHAASKYNLFWELWRDLPEDYVDGLDVDYEVNYVKQINNDGSETLYEKSPKLYWDDTDYTSNIYGPGKWYHSEGPYNEDMRQYECVFFYVDGLYREEVTFEVQYIMNNASLKYNDVSELYLSMYSEDTIKYLESFEAQVLIPYKDMPSDGNYTAHTYGTNSHTFPYGESDTLNPGYHTFYFNLYEDDLQFKNYNQYIEFSLLSYGDDRHVFTNYAPNNYYSNEDYLQEALDAIEEYDNLPMHAEKNKRNLLIFSIIVSILIIIFTFNNNKKRRKKYTFYEPTMTMDYYRDIPSDLDPYFAANLVFCKNKIPKKIDSNSYSALMLDLVRKGYIELTRVSGDKDWVFDNIMIKILYNPFKVSPTVMVSNESATNLEVPKIVPEVNTVKDYVPLFPTMAGHTSSSDIYDIIHDVEDNNPASETSTIVNPFIEHANNVNKLQEVLQRVEENEKSVNSFNSELEKLTANEEAYFNLLIKHTKDDCITMKEFQTKVANDYDNTDTFVTSVENSIVNIGISQGYLQKADYKKPRESLNKKANAFIIISLIIMIFGNINIAYTRIGFAYGALFIVGFTFIICAIYLKHISKSQILLTQFGEDEYAKWRALYNFLNSETLMNERTVVELPLWEKYLVYATAFGISEKVVKALEVRCPDYAQSPMLENKYYRSSSFRTYSYSFGSSTRRASSISRTYSSGGGSYYGGGGRGGGGGGGGH